MSAGVIESALAAIVAAVKTVQPESGYTTPVKYVSRHPMVFETLSSEQQPCAFVARVPPGDSALEALDKNVYKQPLHVVIAGYIPGDGHNPDDQGLSTLGEAFVSDLKRLQMADPTFGSADIHESKITADFNRAGWDSAGAAIGIEMEVYCYFDGVRP